MLSSTPNVDLRKNIKRQVIKQPKQIWLMMYYDMNGKHELNKKIVKQYSWFTDNILLLFNTSFYKMLLVIFFYCLLSSFEITGVMPFAFGKCH